MNYQFVNRAGKYGKTEFTVQEILFLVFHNFRFAYVVTFPTLKKKKKP